MCVVGSFENPRPCPSRVRVKQTFNGNIHSKTDCWHIITRERKKKHLYAHVKRNHKFEM